MTVKETILAIARKQSTFKTAHVVRKLHGVITRQAVSSAINELVREGLLIRSGVTKSAMYALPQNRAKLTHAVKRRLINRNVSEDEVYKSLTAQSDFLPSLPRNVSQILAYAFTEMLNNAIEHSASSHIEVTLEKEGDVVRFTINDTGVGVFRSVMRKRRLKSELESVQDLLKGKTTTAPKSHSGEGIFFTSKVADVFVLVSFGYRLRVDNQLPDYFIEEVKPQKRGTKVVFAISVRSSRQLSTIFNRFQSEPSSYDFGKTEVHVRLYALKTTYISRSQARRLLAGLEKFKVIVLNFERVPTVGQAFADEIFRVFAKKHPEIKVKPINMNETVTFMVKRTGKHI